MGDKELRRDIVEELDYEPSIDAADLGVAVEDGVATLMGHVRSLSEKLTAIEIVESVRGVRAIADEIEVRPVGEDEIADDEIARRIANSLKWNTAVPEAGIHIRVEKGWVTLSGEVDSRHQAEAAENTVHRLGGVTGVTNEIRIVPSVNAADISERIRRTLVRDAEFDASGIRIEVNDGVVTLEGKLHYLGERRAVERAAWAAPGVSKVVDKLTVL